MLGSQVLSVNEQTGWDEVGFYDENGAKYAVVSRRRVVAYGGPMRVYECLHLCPSSNDDCMLMTRALFLFKDHDQRGEE